MKMLLSMACIFLFLLFFIFPSCEGTRPKKFTPNEYLNYTEIDKERYAKDSIEILKVLRGFLTNHQDFFYSKEYFDSTRLIIDTIVYSNDFKKLATFIITQNPTNRQLIPERKYDLYYNATCYLGIRSNDTIFLSWLGPNFSNFYSIQDISSTMRESYFTEFATTDTSRGNLYKYNLNDIRFWDSPIWDRYFKE